MPLRGQRSCRERPPLGERSRTMTFCPYRHSTVLRQGFRSHRNGADFDSPPDGARRTQGFRTTQIHCMSDRQRRNFLSADFVYKVR